MSIMEIISITIALTSLIVSIYVVIRDQKTSEFELVLTMYERLEASNNNTEPLNNVYTVWAIKK